MSTGSLLEKSHPKSFDPVRLGNIIQYLVILNIILVTFTGRLIAIEGILGKMQMPSTLCLLYNKDDDDESTFINIIVSFRQEDSLK